MEKCKTSETGIVELDELYWFLERKPHTKTRENVYIMTMVSRNLRQIVGHVVSTDKSSQTIQKMVDAAKLPILCALTANGTTRYNDLLRNIKGISNTMLSKSLRELEDAGLVKRFEYLEIPVRVEYALTEKAVRLQPILLELIQWEIRRETEEDNSK